ncbi:MAG: hypothetical protein FWC67_04405 [Defluviitaleaceae bacterium]|nr:hypothetical protein [Defluviitaleaceae bacterium]
MDKVFEQEKIKQKGLDIQKLKNRQIAAISTEESLLDIIPIEWDTDVLNAKAKILLVDKFDEKSMPAIGDNYV